MSAETGIKPKEDQEKSEDKRAKALFLLAVKGDLQAFAEIYEIYRTSVIEAFFKKKIFDNSLAEVLTPILSEETYDLALEKVKTKDENSDPKEFLENVCKNIWKKNQVKNKISEALLGDENSLNEVLKFYRNSVISFFHDKTNFESVDLSEAAKSFQELCNKTFAVARETIEGGGYLKSPDINNLNNFLHHIAANLWFDTVQKNKIKQGGSKSEQVLDKLEMSRDDIINFFCEKVCGDSAGTPELRHDLQELCNQTLNKAREEIQKEYPQFNLNYLDEFLHHKASNLWFDAVHRSNKKDPEAFKFLFMLCHKAIKGFFLFKARGSEYGDIDELINITYLQAYDTLERYPYVPSKTLRQYFLNSAWLVWQRYINSGRRIEFLIREFFSKQASQNGNDRGYEFKQEEENNSQETPMDILIKKERIKIALQTLELLTIKGKPHQFLAFGYNKYLEWGPQMVVAECSGKEFIYLSQELVKNIYKINEGMIDVEELAGYFKPLITKLKRRTDEVYPNRNPFRQLIADHGGKSAGELMFDYFDYFQKKPEGAIANWTNRLLEAARQDDEIRPMLEEMNESAI